MVCITCVWTWSYQRYKERVFETKSSSNRQCRVETAQQSSKQDEFADVGLHRKTSQMDAQRCKVLWAVQGSLVPQKTQAQNKTCRLFIPASINKDFFSYQVCEVLDG